MRMPLILTRLLVYLASWSVSSRHPRTWEEWVVRRPVLIRMPLLPHSSNEQQPPLEVSPAQAERLKEMVETAGWGQLRKHLARLSQEVSDYLYEAENPEDFYYRKGYWDGHARTINYVDVLISMAETTDEEWTQARLGAMLEPFRGISLPKEVTEEQEERLSRVLEKARQKTVEN